jgi:prephenate dehydrogenase
MSKITIIGLGLIGTSIGMALRKARVNVEIVGHDKDRGASNKAAKMGATDKNEWNLIRAVEGAMIVIIATPVKTIEEVMQQIAPELPDGCIVTDTGSTKATVLNWAQEHLPPTVSFVGGHPMAGKELSGPEGAEATLFQGAPYCIMPGKNATTASVKTIVEMIEILEATPYFIDPGEHDSYVAAISHLPMLLSSVLVKITSESPAWPEMARLASSGYRDVSRLASQDPEMNRDICLTTHEGLGYWIDEFIKELYRFRGLIKDSDESLFQIFDDIWVARDRLMQNRVPLPSNNPHVNVPSSSETAMGMVMGDRAAEKIQEMFKWYSKDDYPKRKRQ